MRSTLPTAVCLALAALLPQAAAAQGACKAPSPDCVAVGEWDISIALGAGGRTNPLRGESDIPLLLIPQISYYGKRFFLESLELGYTLFENDTHTINLIGTPGYDRVFFYRNDLQNIFVSGAAPGGGNFFGPVSAPIDQEYPVHRRRTTYLMGPEWSFSYGRLVGQLDALYEVTGRHDGFEVRAAVATPIIQSKSSLVLSAGLTWKSARLVDYYYGVADLYEPRSAVNPFIKLGYSLPLSPRWALSAFGHYEYLDDGIAGSPLVDEHGVATVFAGFVFKVL